MVELGGRHLNLSRFLHRARKINLGHARQPEAPRKKLAQDFEPLADKIGRLSREAGDVVAWSGEARDETTPDRVRVDGKDDRNNRCGLLERWNCSAKCNYDVDSQSDKLSRNFRVSLHAVFRPAMLDCDGAALDPAELAKPFQKRGVPRTLRPTRSRAEKPDRRQLLLRAHREGPRCCRAAECDQQFPSSEGDCHTPLPCEGALRGTIPRRQRTVLALHPAKCQPLGVGWSVALL